MVTVLFADLVDSTGLAQRLDPERAREVLGRFFDAATEELQALRGRPEKFIGDAVMAVFGLPAGARGRRPARGAGRPRDPRATAPARRRPRPRRSRSRSASGVESGEAATGTGPAGQLLVTGLRRERGRAAADGGRARRGAGRGRRPHALTETRRLVRRPAGRASRRGSTDTLAGFPVEGLSTRSARRTIPFVGRASELTILRESLSRAGATRPARARHGARRAGHRQVAAGRRARRRARRRRPSCSPAAARSYTDTATFAPVATIVAELAGIDGASTPAVAKEQLRRLVERLGRRRGRRPDRRPAVAAVRHRRAAPGVGVRARRAGRLPRV